MIEQILAATQNVPNEDKTKKRNVLINEFSTHQKDFHKYDEKGTFEISNLQERIAAAEKLRDETQYEIKKFMTVNCNHLQSSITKLMYFCNYFEANNKKLEDSLTRMIRQHFEKIDLVKDAIRRLSLIETELECQVQKLKLRLVELEDNNNRQGEFIKILEERVSRIGVETIKDLQSQMLPLEEENRKLETVFFDAKRDQEELIAALQHKERLLKIERTQQESDIKRLSAGVQFMDDMRQEIQKNIQVTKVNVKTNSKKEMKKIAKLTSVWKDLSERYRIVYKEKMQAENENLYLRQKIHKMNEEINVKKS